LLTKTDVGKPRASFSTPQHGAPAHGHSKDTTSPAAIASSLSQTAPAGSLDYVKMNSKSVARGVVTSAAQTQDREQHQIRRRPSAGIRPLQRSIPDVVFGMPSGPSDHVDSCMVHPVRPAQPLATLHAPERQKKKLSYGITRATLLRQKVPEPPPEPLWTMPRFRTAHATIQSFRSDAVRTQALAAMAHGAHARQGTVGHGLPHTAGEC